MTARQISQNVWVEDDVRGANHGFVVTSDGLVLFDVPVDVNDARAWREAMRSHGAPRYIVNAEFHFDHNMNNHVFECPVIASDVTREIIVEANSDRWLRRQTKGLYRDPLEVPSPEDYRRGWPSITFSDEMTLRVGEHTFQMMWLPGHTLGQTAVYVPEERLMFVADQVGTRGYAGLHDSPGDVWIESVRRLMQFEIDTLLIGHGKVVTDREAIPGILERQIEAISVRLEAVKRFKAEGLTVDETCVKVAEIFPPGGFERMEYEGFRERERGVPEQRRWVVHQYHATGANVSWT